MSRTKLTRRQFVSTISAGAGTVIIGKAALASIPPMPLITSDTLKIVRLGNSGLKTTLLGMGTGFSSNKFSSTISGNQAAGPVIRHAYEMGIRYFDCADSYGTHSYISSALKAFPRESYTLGTKMWVGQGGLSEPERPDADIQVERFRKELGTDYLDLIQIHCMTDANWTEKEKRQMDILENLKAKGFVRAHGVSVHSLEAMEACIGNPWVDVVHVRINPYGESMDKNDPSEVIPVIEKLHSEGKGIIGMKLTGSGEFRNDADRIDESLRYVFGSGSVDIVIAGFELAGQIDNYLSCLHRCRFDKNL